MDTRELFERCIHHASDVVRQVEKGHFNKPTPASEWSVKDLLGHMLYELAWAPDVINGRTIRDVGRAHDGNLMGDDPHISWKLYRDRALITLEHSNLKSVAHLSYGDVPLEEYLLQSSADFLIHAWDLGEAISRHLKFNQDVAAVIEEYTLGRADAMKASGLFADPLAFHQRDDVQTRLLALYGRSKDWRHSTS